MDITDFLNFETWFYIGIGLILVPLVAVMGYFVVKATHIHLSLNFIPKNYRKASFIYMIAALVMVGSGLLINWMLYSHAPSVVATNPAEGETWDNYDVPVRIEFDRPINKEKVELNISPDVEGDWTFVDSFPFLGMSRIVEFTPKETFLPGEEIIIYIAYITNSMNPDAGNEFQLKFGSVELAEIEEFKLANGDDNVSSTDNISFSLTKSNKNLSVWEAEIEPEAEIKINTEAENQAAIELLSPLDQGTTYKLKIFQTAVSYDLINNEVRTYGDKELVRELEFTTVNAPNVSELLPKGNAVLPNQDISIQFDKPMNPESVEYNFALTPEVDGTFRWSEDNLRMEYLVPGNLNLATEYKLHIPANTKSSDGGRLSDDISHTFTTVGNARISAASPWGSQGDVDVNASLFLTFDQPINQDSAVNQFFIDPFVPGSFSWSGTTLTYNPSSSLENSKSYTYGVKAGVASVYTGASISDFAYRFTTKAQIVMIDIPWDGQDTDWTCNFAATKMALSAKGVYVSENDLISKASIQPSFDWGTMSGGNPHLGYVDGYGTYWEPVSTAASAYRPVEVRHGMTIGTICGEIANGNPVVTWGQNGWSTPTNRDWTTSDGTFIDGVSGMHSVVVRGCEGPLDNPTFIYIQDPWRKWGNKLDLATFLYRISYFGNTGMIVR